MKRNYFRFVPLLFALWILLTACESRDANILEEEGAIDELSNSVLMLECYDAKGNLYSSGSGFVAFQENIIVTCYHVIQDEVFSIIAYTENGESFEISKILIYNENLDLAILELDQNSGLPPLEFNASSEISKGDAIVAIGSPLGLINSVSDGIVSSILNDGLNTIQFTASISHGSSGGVLLTKAGKVAGVTYASFEDGQNLNLAIPSSSVIELWESKKSSDQMTMEEFYNTFPHIMTVKDIISNRNSLSGQKVKVRGFISSAEILTYGTQEPKEVRFYLADSQEEVSGWTIVIDDWSTATEEENQLSDYEYYRWKNRGCISIIVDESLLLTPVEVGSEIVVEGEVIHFNFSSTSLPFGYEDCVSISATEYS